MRTWRWSRPCLCQEGRHDGSGNRRREPGDGGVKSLGRADKVGKQLLIDIQATLVFGQVAFVVSFEERLYVGVARAQRVSKSLEDGDAVLGSKSLVTKGSEGQPVGGAVRQLELAIGLYAVILCIGQASTCRCDHAVEFLPRGSLGLETPDLYEIVELLPAHG